MSILVALELHYFQELLNWWHSPFNALFRRFAIPAFSKTILPLSSFNRSAAALLFVHWLTHAKTSHLLPSPSCCQLLLKSSLGLPYIFHYLLHSSVLFCDPTVSCLLPHSLFSLVWASVFSVLIHLVFCVSSSSWWVHASSPRCSLSLQMSSILSLSLSTVMLLPQSFSSLRPPLSVSQALTVSPAPSGGRLLLLLFGLTHCHSHRDHYMDSSLAPILRYFQHAFRYFFKIKSHNIFKVNLEFHQLLH